MGGMADHDIHQNVNNTGSIETSTYRCGLCKKKFGTNKRDCQKHVNTCQTLKGEGNEK